MSQDIKSVGAPSGTSGRNAQAARSASNQLIEKAKDLGEKAKAAWLPNRKLALGKEAFEAVRQAAAEDASNPEAWRLYAESLSEMGLATFASAAISQVGGGEKEFLKSVQTVLSKMNGLGLATDKDNQLKKDLLKIQDGLK